MLSVQQARAALLARVSKTGTETVSVAEAYGRVLAQPVVARLTQPPTDVSAMDGYAVRAADRGDLHVIGAAPAGKPFGGTVGAQQAVRLFTGSVLPDGADAILLQENAAVDGDFITATAAPRAGQHIRRRGQDFSQGDTVLAPGKRLGARDIGLIAAANCPWVLVHRRPRVAILATGNEIVLPGETPAPGSIVSSNSLALAAMARSVGAEPVVLPIAPDSLEDIAAAVRSAAGMDLLVTTGGASVGDHDLVRPAFEHAGATLDFWKIAMRPGKPMMSGGLGSMIVIGLPGNPVSSFVCGVLFLLPALRRLAGLDSVDPPMEQALAGASLRQNDKRADHLRATLSHAADGALVATPFDRQDSALQRLLAEADALIVRPPDAPALPAGAPVEIIRLDDNGL